MWRGGGPGLGGPPPLVPRRAPSPGSPSARSWLLPGLWIHPRGSHSLYSADQLRARCDFSVRGDDVLGDLGFLSRSPLRFISALAMTLRPPPPRHIGNEPPYLAARPPRQGRPRLAAAGKFSDKNRPALIT